MPLAACCSGGAWLCVTDLWQLSQQSGAPLPPTLLTRDHTFTALHAVLLMLKVLFCVAKYGKGVLTSQSLHQVLSIEQRRAKFRLIRTLQKSEPYLEGVWSPAKTNTWHSLTPLIARRRFVRGHFTITLHYRENSLFEANQRKMWGRKSNIITHFVVGKIGSKVILTLASE